MKPKLTLALVALITGTAFGSMPKVLPEFKNAKQLAEWRAEMAENPPPQTTVTEDHAFYTGKPYVESSGAYAFKYRSYSPELARWTSEDPGGFPDGTNNLCYAPVPSSEVDPNGLWSLALASSSATNPTSTDDGYVSIWGLSRRISAEAKINTGVGYIPGSTSDSINARGYGNIDPLVSGLGGYSATVHADFTVSIDDKGIISVTPTGGNWNSPGGDLAVAATWGCTTSGNLTTFTYTVQSKWASTGVSGGGLVGGAITWTGGEGLQDTFVSVTYQAFE